MCKVEYVKAEAVFTMAKEILSKGNSVRLTVTGTSMYPFLREHLDSVELVALSILSIHIGDIVLILRDNGEYVMHRIVKKSEQSFYMAGDAQNWIEGPVRYDQIVAVVKNIWRNEKQVKCSNVLWRVYSKIWMALMPLRGNIFNTWHFLSRVKKRL